MRRYAKILAVITSGYKLWLYCFFLVFGIFPILYKAIYNFEYQNLKKFAFFLMVSLLLILLQLRF